MAKLYFRYGPMNSGKSTALLQVAHNYEERDQKVCIIKPSTDTKITDAIATRIGASRKVDILADESSSLLTKPTSSADCVLVDEAQFLSKAQVDDLLSLVIDHSVPVIAYGLRTDFQTQLFPGSKRLFEVAHSIEELKTICRCGRKAIFNARFVDGKKVMEGSQVAIDGTAKVTYEAQCAQCYSAQ